MNIAIVDDDKTAARLLADKLKGFEEAHISGIAANGMDWPSLWTQTPTYCSSISSCRTSPA